MDPLRPKPPGLPTGEEEAKADVSPGGLKGIVSHISDPLQEHPEIQSVAQYATCTLKAARERFTASKVMPVIDPSVHQKVTLVLKTKGGLGDIHFIHNAALSLLEQGCEVSIAILPGQKYSDTKVKGILSRMSHSNEIQLVTSGDPEARTLDPDSVIIGPTRPDQGSISDHFPALSDKPSQLIHEYGTKQDRMEAKEDFMDFPMSAGLGPGQIGIFTGDGLGESLSKGDRISRLATLAEHHPEKMDLVLQGKSSKEYIDSTKLFFGYAHTSYSMAKFVSTIALSEIDDPSKDIDIVIPWRPTTTGASTDFKDRCKYDKKELLAAGIGRVEIVTADGVTTEDITADGTGKVLRIINPFPFPHETMEDLLAVSEDLTLTTGDQSWNDAALNPDKVMFYERMPWKADFYRSTEVLSESQPLVARVMKAWDSRDSAGKVAASVFALRVEAEEAKQSDRPSQSRAFHASLVSDDHNLENSLHREALRLSAIGHIPRLKAEYDQMEAEIKEVFLLPTLVEKCSQRMLKCIAIYTNSGEDAGGIMAREDYPFVDHYRKVWNETDTSSIPQELIDSMEKGFEMIDRMRAGETPERSEGYGLVRELATLGKKMIPIAQERLKELQQK